MKNASRVAAVLALFAAAVACEAPAPAPIALPAGLALGELDAGHRALLRATLAIDGGLLDETTVVLDAEAGTVSADVVLANVGDGGPRVATLRVYGRDIADSDEVLLGIVDDAVTITPAASVFIDFDGRAFDTCAPGVDGACGLVLDRNRNGRPNIDDLIAGVDPGPAAPFLVVSPSTLQFSSGIRLGAFGRQVVVTENLGDHPVRIELVQVAGGQGVTVALFNPDEGSTDTPRRRIDITHLDDDGDGVGDVVLAPGEELFVAVSFAPVNSFLTTAAVQVVATDVVTGVSQGSRTKVIANSDGALRPRDPAYVEPAVDTAVSLGGGDVVAQAFPAGELFSGAEITAPVGATGLVHSGSSLVIEADDGATISMPADAAFVVDVGAGQRFTGALASAGDVDMALVELTDTGAVSLLSTSRQQGESAEAVELFNGGESTRRLVVVLGRIDLSAPVAVVGALVDDEPLPFRLSCQLTRGPELDDVQPILPLHGPLDGGVPVTLRGRGFYVPRTPAGPHARVSFNGVASVATPQVTTAEDGSQTLAVVLPPGGIAADVAVTVVVENPSTGEGNGDGQAATLPEGFRYDLPRARLTRVTPDVATTTGSTIDVIVTGAFFFDRHGPPRVRFGDVDVDALVVDSATLLVRPPPHAADDVELTVQNALSDGSYGDASEALDFRFVAPATAAPTLTTLSPDTGSALGGETITVTGTGFLPTTRLLLGGIDTEVTSSTPTQLIAVTRPVASADLVDVVVVNPDGQVAVIVDGFTFTLPAPAITAVIPERASTNGNAIVVVNGAGFRDDTAVSFQNGDGSVSVPARATSRSSSTTLIVTTPPFAAGAGQLVVRNVDGQLATAPFSFFAPQGPAPSIVALSPSSGSVAGGTLVTVTVAAAQTPSVVFGGVAIAAADVVTEAAGNGRVTLKVRSPAGTLGTTALTVINADGQSTSTSFTYIDQQVARVVGVRPAFVHAGLSGDEILVFGEHFASLGPSLLANAIHGAAQQRTPLTVSFHSDGFASLVVETALPAGAFVVELVGDNGTVRSASVAARAPDIALVSKSGSSLVITGTNLGGALLTSVSVNGTACVITTADERSITCTITGEPEDGDPVFELGYGGDVVSDAVFVVVEDGDIAGCEADSCNGQGSCSVATGTIVCACNIGFDPATRCQPCTPVSNAPTCVQQPPALPRTCSDVRSAFPAATSGTFRIDIDGPEPIAPRDVECDMDFDGGGWTRVGATTSNGQALPTVSLVFSVEEVRAIAASSTQVHIRTATNGTPPELFVTSRPGTEPIQNLRAGDALIRTPFNNPTDFVGTMADKLFVAGCAPNAPWPAVYHACGNAGGLHFFLTETPSSRWENFEETPHDSMEIWVREAPVPGSCADIQQLDPLVVSGDYFVGGQYQPCSFEGPPAGDALVVTATGDSVPGDGLCSLREAINAVDANAAGNSGCAEPGNVDTIRLEADVSLAFGFGDINSPMVIDGQGHTVSITNAGFTVFAPGVVFKRLRFTGNASNGPVINAQTGVILDAVIFEDMIVATAPLVNHVAGTLSIVDSRFSGIGGSQSAVSVRDNAFIGNTRFVSVAGNGNNVHAINVENGALTVDSSVFVGNGNSQTSGGAIAVASTAQVTVRNSAFVDNLGGGGGGAIASSGFLDITQCTLQGNNALLNVGGAVLVNAGNARISASTIAGNAASTSGGIRIESGFLVVKDSIMTRNRVTVGSEFVDCSRAFTNASATFTGENVFGYGNCNDTTAPTIDDAGLPGDPLDVQSAATAVARPAAGFVGDTLDVGDCLDLNGQPLGADPTGTPRTAPCTVGAVQLVPSTEQIIEVDTLIDAPTAATCTLRAALLAARNNTPVDACGTGGERDRIVFREAGELVLDQGTIILDVPGLIIDAISGHAEDIVTITAFTRVLDVRAPTTLRGLELRNIGTPAPLGGVIAAANTSLRLDDVFISAGGSTRGGAIHGNNMSLSLRGSTIAVDGADEGEAIFLDNSAAVIERSTIVGTTSSTLIDSSAAAQLVMRHVSVRGAESGTDALIKVAVAHIDDSIIDAPGRDTLCTGFPRTTGGVASNATCNITAIVNGALSRGLGSNGGRTPTISVDAGLPPLTFCGPGSTDQRGRATDGLCAPGASSPFGSVPSTCGDGFVDDSEGTVLASSMTETLSAFSGAPVIGSGARGASGPTLVVADSAGGDFVFCDSFSCSQPTEIAPGAIAAIALADTSSGFTGPDITVIDADGRLRAFGDTGSGVPVLSTQLDSELVAVSDAIFFADVFRGGGDDFIVTGLDAEGAGVLHYYSTVGGSFDLVASLPVNGTPQRGLVVRPSGSGYAVLMPVLLGNGSTQQRLISVVDNGTLLPTVSLDGGGAPGTFVQFGPTTATLMRGRNGVIWGAQNQGNSISIGRVGLGDVNVFASIVASSLTAGDIDGDGNDELVAIDDGGFVTVLQENANNVWQPYDGLGFAEGTTGNAGARCQLLDVGDGPRPELVCTLGALVQVLELQPTPDEQCDFNDPFSPVFCTPQCVSGGPP